MGAGQESRLACRGQPHQLRQGQNRVERHGHRLRDRQKQDKTELRFTHVGLVPAFECYGDCSGAWGFYINDSLRSLITTGKGQPNQTEEGNGRRLFSDPGRNAHDGRRRQVRRSVPGVSRNHQPAPAAAAPILLPDDRLDHRRRRCRAGCAFSRLPQPRHLR